MSGGDDSRRAQGPQPLRACLRAGRQHGRRSWPRSTASPCPMLPATSYAACRPRPLCDNCPSPTPDDAIGRRSPQRKALIYGHSATSVGVVGGEGKESKVASPEGPDSRIAREVRPFQAFANLGRLRVSSCWAVLSRPSAVGVAGAVCAEVTSVGSAARGRVAGASHDVVRVRRRRHQSPLPTVTGRRGPAVAVGSREI